MSATVARDSQGNQPTPLRQRRTLAYENAGPQRLARTKAVAPANRKQPPKPWQVLMQHATARMNLWRSWRLSWVMHWQLLETYLCPRRGIFINAAMPVPNQMIRGIPINQAIIDPTGVYASRRCSAGMMSGLMSPSRQWFKLKPALFAREEAAPDAVAWFEEVEDRVYTVLSRSNYYESCAQVFEDLVNFGTGPMLIYEDAKDLIRCYTPCCGEYFCQSSSTNRVESFGRLFVMTISAIVEMFGLENCPPEVQQLWQDKGGALEIERLVAHVIEPNAPIHAPDMGPGDGVVPGGFTWREMYWVWGVAGSGPLSLAGLVDSPVTVPRWSVTSNDPYGRSVGMDVLGDLIQLQVETERKAEAIEKQVRPPMLASMELKHEPSSILPGKVTYVNQLGPGQGMRPVFEVMPQITEMKEDIAAIQLRIKEGFFNDLFVMLEQLNDKRMTAYEVAQRNQEKLQILGPVVERLQNEKLAPDLKRVIGIMQRAGLLPPLPDSLKGTVLGFEFVGVLALAQKAAKTASLERFAGTMASFVATHPEVNDLWSVDEWAREYADELFIPQKVMRSEDQVAQIRTQRAKQQALQMTLNAAQQAAATGKDASQIDVGGGLNAISAMTGLGPQQQAQGNA